MRECVSARACVRVCVRVCARVCVRACVCVCVCVFMNYLAKGRENICMDDVLKGIRSKGSTIEMNTRKKGKTVGGI